MSQMPNPYGPSIGLEAARRVGGAAVADAAANGWVIAVAVVDASGDLVFFEKMDGTQVGSIDVALGKARSAVRFKRPTKEWEDALAAGRNAVLGIPGVLPVQGGIPLLDGDGRIVGAIGVSGALPVQDGHSAEAGAVAFLASPGPKR
ncbi:MAG TPA: heme-binding protein [Anaeromyxobacteraceae bacterium]|nr:heme-binding protein [Anaeromyxobacteraceae bacterium]